MKNIKKMLLIPTLILGSALCYSCSNKSDGDTLKIICLDASYGTEWIDKIVEDYQKENSDIKISVEKVYNAQSLIEQHLSSSKNNDDIYISVGANWKYNAASGKFLELDSLLEEEVDGIKIKNKVADEYKESIYYTNTNGEKHSYRLPWTSGIGGIYYNNAMFKKYGWDTYLKTTFNNTSGVPETFEQLIALCNKINDDSLPVEGNKTKVIKPFTYTGANSDYFDYLVFDFWSQLSGVDNIKEFLKYDSPDNFDVSKSSVYSNLKKATSYWYQLFGNSNYVVSDSEAKSASNAQKEFVNGYAAMMVNGDWLYNDTLNYTSGGNYSSSFELKMMKTPTLPDATYPNTSYVIGEDQYIAIPKTAPHQEEAKSFIKYMISDKGCNTFLEKGHGFLAYKANYDENIINNDTYLKSALEVRNSYESKFTNFSTNRKYLCNYLDIWATSATRPYQNMLSGAYDIDRAFQEILNIAKTNWSDWTTKSER